MPPLDGTPFVPKVSLDPGHDLGPQPCNVHGGIVPTRHLSLGVCCTRSVNDMYQGVGVSQIVKELVAQSFALVRSGDETGYVEKFDGDTALAVHAGTVVGLAPIANPVARAGAVYLEVADRSLGVNGGETVVAEEALLLAQHPLGLLAIVFVDDGRKERAEEVRNRTGLSSI